MKELLDAMGKAYGADDLAEVRRLALDGHEHHPSEPRFILALANASLGLGETGEALRWANLAMETHPTHPQGHVLLARATLKNDPENGRDSARAHLNEALRLDPDHPISNDLLKKLEEHGNRSPSAKALSLFKTGVLNAENREYYEAERFFLLAIESDPRYARAYNGLGNILGSQGRHSQAEDAFRKAIDLDPNDTRPRNGLGGALFTLKRFSEAEEVFRKAIDLDPNNSHTRNGLGATLWTLKRYLEAENAYRQGIKLFPDDPELWNGLGNVLTRLKHYQEAKKAYRRAIELNREKPYPWHGLGNVKVEEKQFAEAELAYQQAVNLAPEEPLILCGLAMALRNLKRFSEAEEICRKAISLDQKNSHSWHSLGTVMAKLKRYQEAEDAFRRSIRRDPDHAATWDSLGDTMISLQRAPEAEKAFLRAIELAPNQSCSWDGVGRSMFDLKCFREAENAFRQAIKLAPDNAAPWTHLGNTMVELRRFTEAEESFKRAIELDPDHSAPWNGLGVATSSLKHYPEAEEAFRISIDLDPDSAHPWNGLGHVMADLERFPEAEEAFRQSVGLDPNWGLPWIGLGRIRLSTHSYDFTRERKRDWISIASARQCMQRFLFLGENSSKSLPFGDFLKVLESSSWPLFIWRRSTGTLFELKSYNRISKLLESSRSHAKTGRLLLREVGSDAKIDRLSILHLYGDFIAARMEAEELWRLQADDLLAAAMAHTMALEVGDLSLGEEILTTCEPACMAVARSPKSSHLQNFPAAYLLLQQTTGDGNREHNLVTSNMAHRVRIEAAIACASAAIDDHADAALWLTWHLYTILGNTEKAENIAFKLLKSEKNRAANLQPLFSIPWSLDEIPSNWTEAKPLIRHMMLQEQILDSIFTFLESKEAASLPRLVTIDQWNQSRGSHEELVGSKAKALRQSITQASDLEIKELKDDIADLLIKFPQGAGKDLITGIARTIQRTKISPADEQARWVSLIRVLLYENRLPREGSEAAELALYLTIKAEHDSPRRIREIGRAVIPGALIFLLTGDLSAIMTGIGTAEVIKKLLEIQRERKEGEFQTFDEFREDLWKLAPSLRS